MSRQVKLLQLGDLHLDSPFSALTGEEAAKRNAELRRVFSGAVRYAKNNDVDVILLCGDLFDREYCSEQTLALLRKEMQEFPECRFVISPGNHDPYSAHSPYKTAEFPQNCHVFKDERMSFISFPELGMTVYGYAFTSQRYTARPLEGFRVYDSESLNVLCAHADIGVTGSVYAPVSVSSIASSGLDYAAFGHIHNADGIERAEPSEEQLFGKLPRNSTLYAYSGCIAGRDMSEVGEKGGVLITAVTDGEKKQISAKRITFCPWRYDAVQTDITQISTVPELIDRVRALLSESNGISRRLRVTLKGRRAEELDISATRLARILCERMIGVEEAEVIDNSLPAVRYSQLENEYTLRGAFYRLLKDDIESNDPETAKVALDALNIGLLAIDGGDPWELMQNEDADGNVE